VVRRLAAGVSYVTVYKYSPSLPVPEDQDERWVFLLYSRRVGEAPN
jgi:hypothetical protein